MIQNKKKEINSILGRAKWVLGLGIFLILAMPFILTCQYFHERFNFSITGQIGDTIGGTTAPFLNLIGSLLVFFALKAQVKANELIQEQIDKDNESKESENETQNLNQLFSYLTESINGFRFTSLPFELLDNTEENETEVERYGGEGFYHLFSQIYCDYHGTQEELHSHQSVSELLSILKIMDLLLDNLQSTKSKNKAILSTLIGHLFNYKVITKIRESTEENLQIKFCEDCQCNHGLPDDIRSLIIRIQEKLKP